MSAVLQPKPRGHANAAAMVFRCWPFELWMHTACASEPVWLVAIQARRALECPRRTRQRTGIRCAMIAVNALP